MSSLSYRISLAANTVLVGFIAVQLWRHHAPTPTGAIVVPQHATAIAARRADNTDLQALRPPPDGPELTPAAVAELERLGISREAIADALIDDCTFRYDKRMRALEKKYAPKPVPRREKLAMQREAEAERIVELKAAFGEERFLAWDKANRLGRLNMGGVPLAPQESEQAYHVQKNFDDKARALQRAVEDGTVDPTDFNTAYNQLRQQYDQQLENLFGRDRLAEIQGTPNPVAEVSRRYADLNPTPEQAKAVLQAEGDLHAREAELVQQLKDNPDQIANLAPQVKALTDAKEERLRQIFGADAYNATKRQNDSIYQKLQQYAGAWNLADPQIGPVYEALAGFHDQADLTRMTAEMNEAAGQTVDWHQINSGIEQSRQQLEAALANMIGGDRVRRLRQNGLLDVR